MKVTVAFNVVDNEVSGVYAASVKRVRAQFINDVLMEDMGYSKAEAKREAESMVDESYTFEAYEVQK